MNVTMDSNLEVRAHWLLCSLEVPELNSISVPSHIKADCPRPDLSSNRLDTADPAGMLLLHMGIQPYHMHSAVGATAFPVAHALAIDFHLFPLISSPIRFCGVSPLHTHRCGLP